MQPVEQSLRSYPMNLSRIAALAAISVLCVPAFAWADAPADSGSNWSGSGEFGLANANRAKSNVKTPIVQDGVVIGQATTYQTTANHFDVGGSVGYKFNPRSYLVGAARYDHDDFAPNRWQEVASIGFGYIVLKNARSELSFEAGPGYKRYQPQTYTQVDISVSP